MQTTLVPAYGRDYASKAKAIADFEAGKDFIIADMSSQWDGKPMSIRDCKPGDRLSIRYKRLMQVCVYTVKGIQPLPESIREVVAGEIREGLNSQLNRYCDSCKESHPHDVFPNKYVCRECGRVSL